MSNAGSCSSTENSGTVPLRESCLNSSSRNEFVSKRLPTEDMLHAKLLFSFLKQVIPSKMTLLGKLVSNFVASNVFVFLNDSCSESMWGEESVTTFSTTKMEMSQKSP